MCVSAMPFDGHVVYVDCQFDWHISADTCSFIWVSYEGVRLGTTSSPWPLPL